MKVPWRHFLKPAYPNPLLIQIVDRENGHSWQYSSLRGRSLIINGYQPTRGGRVDDKVVVDLVDVVIGDDVNVSRRQSSLLSLGDNQFPRLDVQVLGQDCEVKHQVGEMTDAVSDVECERVQALVRYGLDVVKTALIDHSL